MKKKKKKEEREKDKSVHTYIRLNIYEYFQRLYRQDCARVGLFSRTNQFFHGIRSCNNFRGSCAFPLTYFPLSTISLVELDRCAAVPYRKRIGAQTSTRLLHLYDPFPFLFFFFLHFHRLSRFEPTLCNSRSFFRTSFMVEKSSKSSILISILSLNTLEHSINRLHRYVILFATREISLRSCIHDFSYIVFARWIDTKRNGCPTGWIRVGKYISRSM